MTDQEKAEIDASVEDQDKPKAKRRSKKGWAHDKTILSQSGMYFCATSKMMEVPDGQGESTEMKLVTMFMTEPVQGKRPQDLDQKQWRRCSKGRFPTVRRQFTNMPIEQE